jgi:hypothetical protein
MVMKPEPWGEALDGLVGVGETARLVLPSPAGVPFTQEMAARYARESHLVFACGRYEGIDARVADEARARMAVDEVTIGDYVLAGGEPAVLVMIEAVCRLLPGVMGNADSARPSPAGAAMPRCAGRRRTARTWPPGSPPGCLTPATVRYSQRLAFLSVGKIWQTEAAAAPSVGQAGHGRAP